jgi:hypothetical protein
MRESTEEQFLKDTANHRMTVLLDSGIYRHIRLKQPGTGNMWFDLVTWPGCLTISGDMGTWTFSRVDDMFTFFRHTPRRVKQSRCLCAVCGRLSTELKINPSYWAEKLQHGNYSGRDGAKVWDQATFQAHLLDQLKNHFEDEPEKLAELKTAVEEDIFQRHDGDGPHMMRHAAYEFTYEFEADRWRTGYGHQRTWKFQFDGMDLPSGMVYSYHFIWCLYAIVWGVQQYDLSAQK